MPIAQSHVASRELKMKKQTRWVLPLGTKRSLFSEPSPRCARRYVNDFCSSEPLNFGESRLWVKGPRGHASRGKSKQRGAPTGGKPSRSRSALQGQNDRSHRETNLGKRSSYERFAEKSKLFTPPLSLENHFCQKEQTP